MAVLLPLWASYLARVYAWIVILNKGGTLNWTLPKLGPGAGQHRLHQHRDVARVLLHLAAVHDHPGVHGAGAHPRLAARGVGGPRRRDWRTLRSVVLPLALPGVVAGSIFTFSLTLGDFITPTAGRRDELEPHRQRHLRQHRHGQQPAVRGRARDRADRDHDRLPARARGRSARSRRCDADGGALARIGLRIWVAACCCSCSSRSRSSSCTRSTARTSRAGRSRHCSTKWFTVAWHDPQVRDALVLSLKAGLLATAMALLLGSAAAFGVHRFRFFGREAVSLLLVLPLALPGIITGIALNSCVPLRRDRALAVHDHHRARDVLHRGGLQQHARPAPADVRVALRGRRRPGRAAGC